MSNTVVWGLLRTLILQTLDSMGDPVKTISVEREGENHPLINYLDVRLSRALDIQGAARCPELKKKIIELKKRNPTALSELVDKLVKEYYSRHERKFYPETGAETIITA